MTKNEQIEKLKGYVLVLDRLLQDNYSLLPKPNQQKIDKIEDIIFSTDKDAINITGVKISDSFMEIINPVF